MAVAAALLAVPAAGAAEPDGDGGHQRSRDAHHASKHTAKAAGKKWRTKKHTTARAADNKPRHVKGPAGRSVFGHLFMAPAYGAFGGVVPPPPLTLKPNQPIGPLFPWWEMPGSPQLPLGTSGVVGPQKPSPSQTAE